MFLAFMSLVTMGVSDDVTLLGFQCPVSDWHFILHMEFLVVGLDFLILI